MSNPLKLRSTARNSIVTYNAIQKVFKSRFDEGRSNSRIQDISNSYTPYPFLSAPKAPYESLLGKNTENFFKPTLYVTKPLVAYSVENININLLNTYFTDLPFLVSKFSDASRHLWFD